MASLSLAPLQPADAHAYWRVYIEGRSDLPTGDLTEHVERYLRLPPEEQRTHFALREESRIVGTVRLLPGTITGFSMSPDRRGRATEAIVRALDLLRAQGASELRASYEDRYAPAFEAVGFRPWFSRMRMEAPTGRSPRAAGVDLRPPEEREVLGLTRFFMEAYEGHMEQRFGIHVGPEAEWREYIIGILKGTEAGRFMPDASFVILESDRVVAAILVNHWMGMPLVADLAVAKDRRGRGFGRTLVRAAMDRLAQVGEPRLALYTTIGNDPAIALYTALGFAQVGGRSVTARLQG